MEVVNDTSQWFFIGDIGNTVADAATQTIGTLEVPPPMPQEMPVTMPPMPPMPPMPYDTRLTIAMGALIGIVGSSVGALLWHRWRNMTSGEPLPVNGQTELAKTVADTDPITAKPDMQLELPVAPELADSFVHKTQQESAGSFEITQPASLFTKAIGLSAPAATPEFAWDSKSPPPPTESPSPTGLPKTAHLIKSPDFPVLTLAKPLQPPDLASPEPQLQYTPTESALISTTRKNLLWQDCFVVGLALAALLATWSRGKNISKFAGACTMPHKKSAVDSSCGVNVKHRVVPTVEKPQLQSTTLTQETQSSQSVAHVQKVLPEPMPPLASQEWVPKHVNLPPQSRACQLSPDRVSVDVGFEIMRASALSPVKPAMHQADVYISNGIIRPPPPTSSRIFRILPK